MQLTLHTDYSLRLLLYLATQGRSATIAEIAGCYDISRNHLVKVAHELGKKGYLITERGRSGGIALAKLPEDIRVGDVVRDMEPNFHIVECFNTEANRCILTQHCLLKHALADAQRAFMDKLDSYTLADVCKNQRALGRVFSATG